MGFASYFEDIQRARDELVQLSSEIERASISDGSAQERLAPIHRACSSLYKTMTRLLEVATDPNFELAVRYFLEKEKVGDEKLRADDIRRELKELELKQARKDQEFKTHEEHLFRKIGALEVKLKTCQEKTRALQDDLKKLGNPAQMYGSRVVPLRHKRK